MRRLGPIFFHGAQKKTRSRLQLGKQEEIAKRPLQEFTCWKKLLSDGTRIKTVSMWSPNPANRLRLSIRRGQLPISSSIAPEQLEWVLESGLIVADFVPAYPLQIYSGTNLVAYFSGAGTTVPVRAVEEYLNGLATASTEICSDTYVIGDWPDTGPTLDGSNAYSSYAYGQYGSLASTVNTALFTGLMRLGVQCKIGARKGESQLCGFGTPDGTKHGLLIDTQTYTFWSAQVDSTGASVKKLVNSADGECLRQQLVAGTIAETDADYLKWIAWLISDLKDGAEAAIELLDSTDLADVYSSGKAPLAHGWKFSRFTNKASIVTQRETANGIIPCKESGMWTVSFSFDGSGVPSASIANDTALTEFRVNPAYHSLWYPLGNQHVILRSDFGSGFDLDTQYDPFAGNEAPIYCWYDDADILQTVTYLQYALTEYGGGRFPTIGSTIACNGQDGFYRAEVITGANEKHTGGYINSAKPLGGLTEQNLGAMTINEYRWSYGNENGTITSTYTSADISTIMTVNWSFQIAACDFSAVIAWKDDFYGTDTRLPARRIIHYGGGDGTHITEQGTREWFANLVIIPENDAEAVYQALLDKWTGGSRQERYGINDGIRNDLGTHGNYACFHSVTPALAEVATTNYEDYPDSPVPNGVGFSNTIGGGFQGLGVQGFMFSNTNVWESDTTDSSATRYSARADLSMPAVFPSVDQIYNSWDYYIWTGQTDDYKSQLVDAVGSYAGSALYSINDALDVEIEGGYSPAYADLPLYKRWIGFI